ncbi:cytochrome P450 [Pseudovirgaria hyperparasitica]|uniref:Bifunctional cytochrome P450/NADPH--P450 reductase n=1 Tax=Pseudovirgaria hyperparasitica TaxID=470096 RepID=A0A6A6WJZ6_9PEZI|nr:cytochrome P450 [Pseudovirgaria hyperparasitica]KAF2761981.1 cytochrome P450 [Pseudovirgaria hyperparasitica]
MAAEETVIPGPSSLPIIGNIADIDAEFPHGTFLRWAEIYGPIYQVTILGKRVVVIGSQEYMNEISDESRFTKQLNSSLRQVRNGVHDGLFTAFGPEEKNWGIAHRVLMPAFGPLSIRNMFDQMHDISAQLAMKWARHGPEYKINVVDDFTRLALDTLALCAMDYRFNSYYRDEMHPFIDAMGDFLLESGNRGRRPGFMAPFYRKTDQKYWDDIKVLQKTAGDVVTARRSRPNDNKDLLNAMLNGKDPKTGETLSDESITDNLITFLIAGHETTSGMLAFTFHFLIKNPQAYQRAQEEVDTVIGRDKITVEHMSKLPYLNAILRESLRVASNIPMIGFGAKEDTTLGGKYHVKKGDSILAFLSNVHRDPIVFGEDANEWKPERMLDEEFEKRNKEFPNNWKPFGNGMRACIGRPFAWQEALLCVAMLLQTFNFTAADPSYTLAYKQTLTIKPKGFYMHAHLRHGATATDLERALQTSSKVPQESIVSRGAETPPKGNLKKLSIFYGSNTGTCEALAQRLATDAPRHGFQASVVNSLDTAKEKVPTDEPVVVITASYEGQPPDNAGLFVTWLESLKGTEMENVNYAVFACGHHDWGNTFHRIPSLVDSLLEQRGGKRIAPMGKADAAAGDMFSDFESWEDTVFWTAMKEKYGLPEATGADFSSELNIEISTPRTSTLRQDVNQAQVSSTKILTAPNVPEKRHIEIELPSDMAYSAGDYLAVLPLNPKENVQRAMRHFGLAWDTVLTISTSGPSSLPTNTPIPAADLLGAYVELAQPASKRNLAALLSATSHTTTHTELTRLLDPAVFTAEISGKRVSILDLLTKFAPNIPLPLSTFLALLPPMRVRTYSISSSPLWNPSHVTLTYAVLDTPALSGAGRHVGVASNYLSSLEPGDRLYVSVRPSHASFHLPRDVTNTPVFMLAAGTGVAPFRGFVQERAALVGAGRDLAPALLILGCRYKDQDDIHADELRRWEAIGAVRVLWAYSREPEKSEGCKYVQDVMWREREKITELWEAGARVFVCGSRDVGEGVKKMSMKMLIERQKEQGKEITEESAEEWFEGVKGERFATDVFA